MRGHDSAGMKDPGFGKKRLESVHPHHPHGKRKIARGGKRGRRSRGRY